MKSLTSLNKEVRPCFLGDKSIWSFPSVLPLAITAFRGSEGHFGLAIIAIGAFGLFVPSTLIAKWKLRSLDSLRRLRSSRRTFRIDPPPPFSGDPFNTFPRNALPCPSFPWSFRKYQGKPQKHQGFFNSVQTRCIVKGEAQKSPFFWRFSGEF